MTTAAPKGTGHPNRILQTDLADPPDSEGRPQWIFRVETFVAIEFEKVEEVKALFRPGDPKKAQETIDYLISKVPGNDPIDAQRMIAAAFGRPNPTTSGRTELPADVAPRRENPRS